MIDPFNITNFNRTESELQELIVFAPAVAGKRADIWTEKVNRFLSLGKGDTPFERIKHMIRTGKLLFYLTKLRLGKYNLLNRAYRQIIKLDLKYLNLCDLMAIPGIGPKSARMILLHSFPDKPYAVLDTHILRYMREEMGVNAPKTTPSGKKYLELEKLFIDHVKKKGKSLAEYDLMLWKKYTISKLAA